MTSRTIALLASVLGLVVASTPVYAQDAERDAEPSERDIETARNHYEAGVSYYEQLRYDEAAAEFREAYRLSRRPHLLKNIATSLQHARRWADSVAAYGEYLELVPDADDRDAIEARVARLREIAEGEARGEQATDDELPEAGRLEDEHGTEVGQNTPEGGAGAGGEQGGDRGGGSIVLPVVLIAGGGALGIAALVTGLVAHDAYGTLDTMCLGGVCDPSLAGKRDEGFALAVASTVLTGVAVVAGAIGIVLLILSGGDEEEAPSVTPSAWLTGEGGGVSIHGTL